MPHDDEDAPVPATAEDGSLLGRLRRMPVGVEDPNIVGDAGPGDVPPGPDPVEPAGSTEPESGDPVS